MCSAALVEGIRSWKRDWTIASEILVKNPNTLPRNTDRICAWNQFDFPNIMRGEINFPCCNICIFVPFPMLAFKLCMWLKANNSWSVDLICLTVILSFDFAIVCYTLGNRNCFFIVIGAKESWEAASDKFTSFMWHLSSKFKENSGFWYAEVETS